LKYLRISRFYPRIPKEQGIKKPIMPEIIKEALVPYSPEAMFSLVTDIESYPLFLPWCPKVQIHEHIALNENTAQTDATLFVQKGFIKFSFRTKNTNKNRESIEMHLIEGPFQELQGTWEFTPLGDSHDACKIKFSLSYVFSNRALDMTLNPLMQKLADSFLDAFSTRAHSS
jgi:ribosome-associated toxin RatA of RatAB toxin-antitoxin module